MHRVKIALDVKSSYRLHSMISIGKRHVAAEIAHQ
jgi:hypothetical protein